MELIYKTSSNLQFSPQSRNGLDSGWNPRKRRSRFGLSTTQKGPRRTDRTFLTGHSFINGMVRRRKTARGPTTGKRVRLVPACAGNETSSRSFSCPRKPNNERWRKGDYPSAVRILSASLAPRMLLSFEVSMKNKGTFRPPLLRNVAFLATACVIAQLGLAQPWGVSNVQKLLNINPSALPTAVLSPAGEVYLVRVIIYLTNHAISGMIDSWHYHPPSNRRLYTPLIPRTAMSF